MEFEKSQLDWRTDTFNTYVHRDFRSSRGFSSITLFSCLGFFSCRNENYFANVMTLLVNLLWQPLDGMWNQLSAKAGAKHMESNSGKKASRVLEYTKLTMRQQHALVAKEANSSWARSVSGSWSGEVILPTHSDLARPHLQRCGQSQAPQHKTDVGSQEQVQ